jgi:hypothetical protein
MAGQRIAGRGDGGNGSPWRSVTPIPVGFATFGNSALIRKRAEEALRESQLFQRAGQRFAAGPAVGHSGEAVDVGTFGIPSEALRVPSTNFSLMLEAYPLCGRAFSQKEQIDGKTGVHRSL